MTTRGLASVLSLSFVGINSMNNCRYFGTETGPLIPIDVCMKWDAAGAVGAYSYECDGLGEVYLNAWDNDDCSGTASATSQGAIIPDVLNCGGGVCNHVIIREYAFTETRENMCYKNESYNPYFEYAFVTDCWDSEYVPDRSWYVVIIYIYAFIAYYIYIHPYNYMIIRSMECSADSMSLKFWDQGSCNGDARNVTKITEGCKIESDLNIPDIISNFTNFTLPTFNSNSTYFEIQGCGGATKPWLWILITCIVAICCAGCCCFCLCRYFYKKRCKGCKGKSPLLVNDAAKEGTGTFTTTTA